MPRLTTRIAADDPFRKRAQLLVLTRRELSERSQTAGRRIRMTACEAAPHLSGQFSIANVPDPRPNSNPWDIVLLIRRLSTPICDRIIYELFVNERSTIAQNVRNSFYTAIPLYSFVLSCFWGKRG